MADDRRDERTTGRIFSDIGPWSPVPEWLLDADVSDRAVRLFALLGRYADANGHAYPRRRTLASRLGCSVDTLDRALAELADVDAVEKIARTDDDGQRANDYYLRYAAPTRRGSRTDAAGGAAETRPIARASDQSNESHLTRENPPTPPRPTVNRRPVTDAEERLAYDLLLAFNERFSTSFTIDAWRGKFVMRIREHPELELHDHERIMRANWAQPWWDGPPSPSVIYGSAEQFERSMVVDGRRGGRGLTPQEIAAEPIGVVDAEAVES